MMRDWQSHRDNFLSEILSVEGPPQDKSCGNCGRTEQAIYRCSDCFYSGLLCLDCCLKDHIRHPFHHIKVWTGQYFSPTTLHRLGYILHLGHGGLPCPISGEQGERDSKASKGTLIVVDIRSIHSHSVSWCRCPGAPSRPAQLLRMHLYPASIQSPRTAFTFQLLEYYHLDSVECNTTPLSFCNKLRRLTNKYNPDAVPVSAILLVLLNLDSQEHRIDIGN